MTSSRDRWALLGVLSVLAWVYAPGLARSYYMRDELLMVQDTPPSWANVAFVATVLGWKNARPLAYPFYGLYAWIDARGGLLAIRAFQVAAALWAAAILWRLLRRRLPVVTTSAITLFACAQPAVTIYASYSPMAPYWIGVVGAWLAFERLDHEPLTWPRRLGAALLLATGWLTFQAAAFGIAVPIVLAALTASDADWPRVRRACRSAGVIFGVTAVLYVVATKLMVTMSSVQLTSPVQRAFALLSGGAADDYRHLLDPLTLTMPFEWWNYPRPQAALDDATYLGLTAASALAWLLLLGAAWRLDLRETMRTAVSERWAVVLASLACAALPVALEGIKQLERQHVAIAFVPAAVVAGGIALQRIGQAFPRCQPIGMAALALMLAWVVVGARAGIARGVVAPHADALAFATDEVARGRGSSATQLVVVNAQETPCTVEPCRGLFGRTSWLVTRVGHPKVFRRLAAEALARPGMNVTYQADGQSSPAIDADTVVVDFRQFEQRRSNPQP